MHNKRVRVSRGFSLIELIVVIVLMAILVGVAAPRFFGRGDFEGPAYAQELASAARYAQKLAVVSGCPVDLNVTATGYALFQPQPTNPPCTGALTMTRKVTHPAFVGAPPDFAFESTVPGGVTITGSLGTIRFGASGVPNVPASFTVGGQAVTIAAGSGYVEVQ